MRSNRRRLAWYRVRWNGTVRDLAGGLKRHQFNESNGSGFVLDRVRNDRLDGRFVERIDVNRTLVDPFGNEVNDRHTEYRVSAFAYRGAMPELETQNAPRAASLFIMKLAEAMQFSAAIERASVNPLEWCREFEARTMSEIRVRSVGVAGVSVAEGVMASCTLNGMVDVREALLRFVGKRRFSIERVELQLVAGQKARVRLSSSGSAAIIGEHPEELCDQLRDSLGSLLHV